MAPTAQTSACLTVAEIAGMVGGRIVGRADLEITGVRAIDRAQRGELTFAIDRARAAQFGDSGASVLLVSRDIDLPPFDDDTRAVIEVADAERALIPVLAHFAEMDREDVSPGVHASAVVDAQADVAATASIGPLVTVGPGARIADHVVLRSGARIGARVQVGEGTIIGENVVVQRNCTIGRGCVVHAGASIGADGFNYRPSADGSRLLKVPHLSHVEIADDVEIGANTCIDRGKFEPTRIGTGTKIDNLVQIGHNCQIGRCVIIAGMVAIAGSVVVEDGVQIGGQGGVADHLRIGAGARICGHTGVIRDVAPGETVFGTPAQPRAEYLRQIALLRRLRRWMADIEARLDGREK